MGEALLPRTLRSSTRLILCGGSISAKISLTRGLPTISSRTTKSSSSTSYGKSRTRRIVYRQRRMSMEERPRLAGHRRRRLLPLPRALRRRNAERPLHRQRRDVRAKEKGQQQEKTALRRRRRLLVSSLTRRRLYQMPANLLMTIPPGESSCPRPRQLLRHIPDLRRLPDLAKHPLSRQSLAPSSASRLPFPVRVFRLPRRVAVRRHHRRRLLLPLEPTMRII